MLPNKLDSRVFAVSAARAITVGVAWGFLWPRSQSALAILEPVAPCPARVGEVRELSWIVAGTLSKRVRKANIEIGGEHHAAKRGER